MFSKKQVIKGIEKMDNTERLKKISESNCFYIEQMEEAKAMMERYNYIMDSLKEEAKLLIEQQATPHYINAYLAKRIQVLCPFVKFND